MADMTDKKSGAEKAPNNNDKKPKKEKTVAKQKKQISLRCPLVILPSELKSNGDGYTVSTGIEYPDGAGYTENLSSAALIIRLFDSDGEPIKDADGGELFAKQIKFGDAGEGGGLPAGESIEFSLGLDIPPFGKRPASFELSMSRAVFGSAAVEYLHGDFFAPPDTPVLLTSVLSSETADEIKGKFGQSAKYLPEKLSPIVWRCTCGELCQEEVCPICNQSKTALYDYFGDTAAIASPEKKKKKLLIILLCSLGALILVEICVFGIILGLKHASPSETGDGAATAEITTAPAVTKSDGEALADAYIKRGDYLSALEVAKNSGLPDSKITEICEAAIGYYEGKGQYESAVIFAETLEKNGGYDTAALYEKIYDGAMVAGEYEKAMTYAEKLADAEKKDSAAEGAISAAVGKNDYKKAMEIALAKRAASVDRVADSAIAYYIKTEDFDSALSYAAYSSRKEGLEEDICKKAASYWLEKGDFDRAVSYAERAGNGELIKSSVEGMSVAALRKNIPAYFSYLSADKKREALAEKFAVSRFAALIKDDGSVVYGAGMTYTPTDGLSAVSVAVGEEHILILLSDGSVAAFGNNDFGQCSTEKWKNIVQISAGDYHSVGLCADGTVVAVGRNSSGQIKVGSMKSIVSVSAGGRHTLALTSEGKVTAVGENGDGQCATAGWSGIVAISAGDIHSVGLTEDGKLVGAGSTLSGRLDIESFENVAAVSAGRSATVALLADGTVVSAGGVIGKSEIDTSSLSNIAAVYAGDFGAVARKSDGSYVSVGYGAPDLSMLGN